MNHGTCLCGAVRYEIAGPFNMMAHCHCSMCRKHHGAPFATFVAAPFDGFRWLSGEQALGRYRSSEQGARTFCATCVDGVLANVCPNCGGGFTPRPVRPSKDLKGENYLGKYPASTRVRHRPVDPVAHAAFAASIKHTPPAQR